MSIKEVEQQQNFRRHFSQFWSSKGVSHIKVPQIGRQELDLFKLYKAVCKRGGGQAVSNNKLWKQIVDEFGLPATCTSASFTLKNHYQKYLLAYQQKYVFGKTDDTELPELMAGRVRRTNLLVEDRRVITNSRAMFYPPRRGANSLLPNPEVQHNQMVSLQNELKRCYDGYDKSQTIFFSKRCKMYFNSSQIRRIMLGMESGLKQQVTYAINMLTLYSVNTHTPFTFEQYPQFLELFRNFIDSLLVSQESGPDCLSRLQRLRSVMLIIRNLLMTPSNLTLMLKNPLLNTMVQIFLSDFDNESSCLILQIFSLLSKIGWVITKKVLKKVLQKLDIDRRRREELAASLDVIKAALEEREEGVDQIVGQYMCELSCLLIYNSSQVREGALQVLNQLCDTANNFREMILEDFSLVSKIVALMNSKHSQRSSRCAASILVKLGKMTGGTARLRCLQRELILTAASDETVGKLVVDLLLSMRAKQ